MALTLWRWEAIFVLVCVVIAIFSFVNIRSKDIDPLSLKESQLSEWQKRLSNQQKHLDHLEEETQAEYSYYQQWKIEQEKEITEINSTLCAAAQLPQNKTKNEVKRVPVYTFLEYDLSWYQANIRANMSKVIREETGWSRALRYMQSCEAEVSNPLKKHQDCAPILPPKKSKPKSRSEAEIANSPLIFLLHIQKAGGSSLEHIAEKETKALNLRWKENRVPVSLGWKRGRDLVPTKRKELADYWSKYEVITGHYGFGIHEVLWRDKNPAKTKVQTGDPLNDAKTKSQQTEFDPTSSRGYTYVTMFRHPIDRLISLYQFWNQPVFNFTESRLGANFEDFLRNPNLTQALHELKDNHQVRVICGYSAYKKERGEIRAEDLLCAMENLRTMVSVPLIMEDFENSLQILERKLGWNVHKYHSPEKPLIVNSSGNHTGAYSQLSKEELAIAIELTRYDNFLYRYAKCLFRKLKVACLQ